MSLADLRVINFLTPEQIRTMEQEGFWEFKGSDNHLFRLIIAKGAVHNIQICEKDGILVPAREPREPFQCTCGCGTWAHGQYSRGQLHIPYLSTACAYPKNTAIEDVWLAQMLLIRSNEKEFLITANYYGIYGANIRGMRTE